MRRTTGTAAAAVLALLLSSCGEEATSNNGNGVEAQAIPISEGKGGGAQLFEAITAALHEAGGFRWEVEMIGQEISESGVAANGIDASQLDVAVEVQVPLMRIGVRSPGVGEVGVRVVDGELFMSLPPEVELPTDRPWLRI